MMRDRVTLEAILLADSGIALADGARLSASRWRSMGCTGTDGTDICFITAKIDGQRWYARVPRGALNGNETSRAVVLERSPRRRNTSHRSSDEPPASGC